MTDWQELTVGDLCDTISDTYRSNDDEVVLVNTSDVLEGKILNHQSVENKNLKGQFKKTFKKDDILYSEIRPANKRYAYVDFDETEHYIASTKLMVLRPKTKVVIPRFLFAFLSSNQVLAELQHLAETRSGTFPQITFSSELAPMPILVPDFETQEKIVGMLASIEEMIQNNNAINNNLEQQAQAIYASMFTSNVNPSWQQGHLSDLVTVKYGKDHKKLADGCYPVYGSGGIMRYVERPLYDKESVLIPRKGTLNNVMYVNQPFWSVDTMFYTEMRLPNVAKFVFHFVKEKDLASMNAGSAVPSMTTDILNAMELSIPSASALEEFETVVAPMYRTMLENDNQSVKLTELRDALLPKLMSGEIDVSAIQL
ncbi:MAG: restriction endonuclease subunit S [Lachnospiraceae bacterium]|nr:restriction endonuclease subunit S [Lachnospiraceae bacterium]